MATSTYKTFLMHSETETGTFTKLLDIKDYSDLEGESSEIDVSTLSNSGTVTIPGPKESEAWTFTCNYDVTEYQTLQTYKNQDRYYAVWFGGTENIDGTVTPTGTEGKWTVKGRLSTNVPGKGFGDVRDLIVKISRATDPAFSVGE